MISRNRSAPTAAAMSIERTTSANRTVTCLYSAWLPGTPIGDPHSLQNLAVALTSVPHVRHAVAAVIRPSAGPPVSRFTSIGARHRRSVLGRQPARSSESITFEVAHMGSEGLSAVTALLSPDLHVHRGSVLFPNGTKRTLENVHVARRSVVAISRSRAARSCLARLG